MADITNIQFLKQMGLRIQSKRKAQKITRIQLAFEINTNEKYLRLVERGELNVGILTLKKIAEVFNCEIDDFLRDN
ncbi:MAG: helix-turn-helix transcriptional regulator [Flavobacteriia bacterium]|nr:helix-turn-helix transcriptional regulator [Flavobacteriia bacterium]